MMERSLQLQAAMHVTLLSPALNVDESDIVTLSRADLANVEEPVKTLKPLCLCQRRAVLQSASLHQHMLNSSRACYRHYRRPTTDQRCEECHQNRSPKEVQQWGREEDPSYILCPGSLL